MMYFALDFEKEAEVRAAAEALWKKHRVTGELSVRRLDNGKWRLEVNSEKQLRESTIDKFNGKRVEIS